MEIEFYEKSKFQAEKTSPLDPSMVGTCILYFIPSGTIPDFGTKYINWQNGQKMTQNSVKLSK